MNTAISLLQCCPQDLHFHPHRRFLIYPSQRAIGIQNIDTLAERTRYATVGLFSVPVAWASQPPLCFGGLVLIPYENVD